MRVGKDMGNQVILDTINFPQLGDLINKYPQETLRTIGFLTGGGSDFEHIDHTDGEVYGYYSDDEEGRHSSELFYFNLRGVLEDLESLTLEVEDMVK